MSCSYPRYMLATIGPTFLYDIGIIILHMGLVTELRLSCYLVLLSIDSKTRWQDSRSFVTWPIFIMFTSPFQSSRSLPTWSMTSGPAPPRAAPVCTTPTLRTVLVVTREAVSAQRTSDTSVCDADLPSLIADCVSATGRLTVLCAISLVYTETEMWSFWRNLRHWMHWKLSFWQVPMQPVTKISSKWRHFHFSLAVLTLGTL